MLGVGLWLWLCVGQRLTALMLLRRLLLRMTL